MRTASRLAAGLVSLLLLIAAPSALAAIDYSKNAAGGTYAPAVGPPAGSPDAGFDWGAAALGVAVTVAVILAVMLVRRGLRTAPRVDGLRP